MISLSLSLSVCISIYIYIDICIHIYIYIYIYIQADFASAQIALAQCPQQEFGRGDDAVVWKPSSSSQIYRLELFELILLSKLDKQLPVERFEATVSQSTVPPLYVCVCVCIYIYI